MSQTLRWRPIAEGQGLPDALKRCVVERWFHGQVEHRLDGSMGDRAFLEGLHAAGVDGAEQLLHALDQHGEIIVELE